MTDITNNSKNHFSRSRLAVLAASLCAIVLLLGPGLRASSAEEAGTSAVGTKSKHASVNAKHAALNAKAEAARAEVTEETGGLPPVAASDKPKYGGRYFVDFRARTAASYGHAFLWYGRLKENGKVGACLLYTSPSPRD